MHYPSIYPLIAVALLMWTALPVSAQTAAPHSRLYLDAQVGGDYNFAEGAHFGKGKQPLKARNIMLGTIGAPMLRFQAPGWSISAGYSGGTLTYGYRLRMPDALTHNPAGVGDRLGHASGAYAHRFPVLFSRTLAQPQFWEVDTIRHLYLVGFRLDGLIGGGVQRHSNQCLDCNTLSIGPGRDTIRFFPRPYYRRTWGGFVSAGVTAHFYRLGKERLTLRLLVTQGLQDMIIVPLEYVYNSRRGATTLHVRGSGISLTLGYPLLLHTFRPPGSRH